MPHRAAKVSTLNKECRKEIGRLAYCAGVGQIPQTKCQKEVAVLQKCKDRVLVQFDAAFPLPPRL
jgi:hypothetical protein